MRILVLTQYFWPEIGAPQTRLASFVRELQRRGHEVEIVTAMPNYPAGKVFDGYRRRVVMHESWEGAPLHRTWVLEAQGTGARRLASYVSFMGSCLLGLRRCRRPDVVFVESPPLFTALPGLLAARWWGVPAVFNVADLWPDSAVEIGALTNRPVIAAARRLEAWAYRHAAVVNAVTDGVRARLIELGVAPSKLADLPNGVDLELFRPGGGDRARWDAYGFGERPVMLYGGNIGVFMGLDTVIDAAADVEAQDPDVLFAFIGHGSDRERLEAEVARRGLRNVVFHDSVPLEEIAALLPNARAGIVCMRDLPVTRGARPSKTFPIMGSGRPVLFCGVGEGAAMIEDADAGIVTEPGDAAGFAKAVLELAADAVRAAALGANGRRLAEQRFGWTAIVDRWLAQVDAALASGRRRRRVGRRAHRGWHSGR